MKAHFLQNVKKVNLSKKIKILVKLQKTITVL